MVPYSFETNDARFWRGGLISVGAFLRLPEGATFDTLYEEGQTHPKMMSVGLHCRIAGTPRPFQSRRPISCNTLRNFRMSGSPAAMKSPAGGSSITAR